MSLSSNEESGDRCLYQRERDYHTQVQPVGVETVNEAIVKGTFTKRESTAELKW